MVEGGLMFCLYLSICCLNWRCIGIRSLNIGCEITITVDVGLTGDLVMLFCLLCWILV